jgi:hypothetical protein
MPHLNKEDAQAVIKRRHPEWNEFQRHWRFLADSLEGGNRYRHADYTIDPCARVGDGSSYAPWYNYGFDPQTSMPYPISYRQISDRNLVPHLFEMGPDGRDIYILRLARTPVPKLVARTSEAHLSKIFAKEITRDGPPALLEWWEDVDGKGSSIDQWMDETVAPYLLTLGHVDLWFDHPEAPEGARIETRADQLAAGLTSCVANLVLSENILWWRLDSRKADYVEATVFERGSDDSYYWHLTETDSNCYTVEGQWIADRSRAHGFGACPLVRVFDRRKVRCDYTGQSRYESIAELQKAIYNGESERTLSNVQQSHAQLMAPEDFLSSTNQVPIGPTNILPMKALMGPNGMVAGYQGMAYLDPPKGAQEALRTHITDMGDRADRDGTLAKPAGMTTGSTVSQSGISKIADQTDGNAILSKIAEVLANAERRFARMALTVVGGDPEDESVEVVYPKQFELYSQADLSSAIDNIQRAAQTAGLLPETEGELLKRLIAICLPGLSDDRLAELHDEVDAHMAAASAEVEAGKEAQAEQDAADLTGEAMVTSPTSVLLSPTPA